MGWSRLWDDILGDPKLLRAARREVKELELLPWLQAFANQAADGGRLTVGSDAAEPEDIAALLPGVSVERVKTALAGLTQIGVLEPDDDGVLRFAAWKKRQEPGKPSDARDKVAERKRRQRAKSQEQNALGSTEAPADKGRDMSRPPVTRDMSRHQTRPDQTRPDQNRTDQNRPDETAVGEETLEPEKRLTAEALTLTVAANQAITGRYGEQPDPIFAGHAGSLAAAKALREAGVPLDFAKAAIAEIVATLALEVPPRSLKYFVAAIQRRWEAETAHRQARSAPPALGNGTPEVPRVVEYSLDVIRRRAEFFEWLCGERTWNQSTPAYRQNDVQWLKRQGYVPDDAQFLAEWEILQPLADADLYRDRTRAQVIALFADALAAKLMPAEVAS